MIVTIPPGIPGSNFLLQLVIRTLIGGKIRVHDALPETGFGNPQLVGQLGGATQVEHAQQLLPIGTIADEGQNIILRIIRLGPGETVRRIVLGEQGRILLVESV